MPYSSTQRLIILSPILAFCILLSSKPTADTTLCLRGLVFDCLIELVDGLVDLFAGLLFEFSRFALGVFERRFAVCHLRTVNTGSSEGGKNIDSRLYRTGYQLLRLAPRLSSRPPSSCQVLRSLSWPKLSMHPLANASVKTTRILSASYLQTASARPWDHRPHCTGSIPLRLLPHLRGW